MTNKKLTKVGPIYYELFKNAENLFKINVYDVDGQTKLYSKEIKGTQRDAKKWVNALIDASKNKELEGRFGLW